MSKSFGRKQGGQQIQSASTNSSEGTNPDFNSSKAEDYLNSILPPREYSDSGQLWVQYVSPIPATRLDVINLQEELDKKLQER